jgi:hypothetical protein
MNDLHQGGAIVLQWGNDNSRSVQGLANLVNTNIRLIVYFILRSSR